MPGQHAPFAPSAAHRWMRCPGSHNAEAACVDVESKYAREGTLGHAVAAACLTQERDPGDYIDMALVDGVWIKTDDDDEERVTEAMADHVRSYVGTVRALAEGNTLLVEQRLQVIPGVVYGTGDVVILRRDGEALVDDLKLGIGVKVDAVDNEQLMTYAVGVMETYDGLVYDVHSVRGIIHQPRNGGVSEDVWTREQLAAFKERIKAAVAAARDPNAPRIPGNKQCKFCKAAGSCPELREHVFRTAILDLSPVTPASMLGVAMSRVPMIEAWAKAVRAEVERRLLAAEPVPGWKLVVGRAPPRQFAGDEATTVDGLKKAGLKKDDIYTKPELRSVAQIEEVVRGKAKGKKRGTFAKLWEPIAALVAVRGEGKPSVAPESDERPAIIRRPPLEGLSVVNQATEQSNSDTATAAS
jgi:hypothetical protein